MDDIKDLERMISEIWDRDLPKRVVFVTGRGGAINLKITTDEKMLGRKLTDDEIQKIEDTTEDGMYTCGGKEFIKYNGLFDSEQEDGIIIVKRRGKFYLESWEGGARQGFRIVTLEDAEKMISKDLKARKGYLRWKKKNVE